MAFILVPLPLQDFDPTEVAVPWSILREAGHELCFATPDGSRAETDPIMLTGRGLGLLRPVLAAESYVRPLYQAMTEDPAFRQPRSYAEVAAMNFDAILLPGGHAQGVRPYLESRELQELLARHDAKGGLIAAICHGVIVMARAKNAQGDSLLRGRRTTSLLKSQELLAWRLTRRQLGSYYRTYPETTVEDEVRSCLAQVTDFQNGPLPLLRDRRNCLHRGFVVRDGNYISARWPGDAHRFARALVEALSDAP